jgi:hypothetical protein
LIYAIGECWRRTSIWKSVNSEKELEAVLLPQAIVEGINVDEPFPFLLYGHAARAAGGFFCNPDQRHDMDPDNKAVSVFPSKKNPSRLLDSTR